MTTLMRKSATVPSILSVPLDQPACQRVTIHPDEAEQILSERNYHNRKIRRSNVEYLCGVLSKNEWRTDHPAPIVFDRKGNLIDGQHRLKAIQIVRRPVEVLVVTGADPELREHLDTGTSRSLFDRVEFVNDPKVNRIVTQILNQWWLTTRSKDLVRLTPTAAHTIWTQHSRAIFFIASRAAERKRTTDALWRRTAILVGLCLMHEASPAKCEGFLDQINSPLPNGAAARLFREFLFRHQHSGSKAGVVELYEYTLFACGAALAGREDIPKLRRATTL